jgi:hypothetical protein
VRRALLRLFFAIAAAVAACGALSVAASGSAKPPVITKPVITIGALSQQLSAGKAQAKATISAKTTSSPTPASTKTTPAAKSTNTAASALPVYPTLAANSPLLAEAHPYGPHSFWYRSGSYACIYLPDASPNCYTVVAAQKATTPPVNPAAVAAQAATRLDLVAGALEASPTAAAGGLTGAASWFWLSPAPATQTATVSLDGEQVTVRAAADSITWSFGDGAGAVAGPGVAYRAGPPPAGALLHSYGTRCLPGDKGHNPNVLAACGARGYTVAATISWRLSYQASGPVKGSGSLPERTTSANIGYPVSEVRAFLGGG